MDQASYQQQNEAFVAHLNGEFDKAISLYTQILITTQNYELTVSKAQALLSINNVESALKECENAILLDRKRPEGYFRRGICKFQDGNVQAAINDFQEALDKIQGENQKGLQKQIQTYIAKSQAELNNAQLNLNVNNQIQLTQTVNVQKPVQPTTTTQQSIKGNSSDQIIYTWYQNSATVFIEINFSLMDKKLLTVNFKESRIEISFPIDQQTNYELNLQLFSQINSDDSTSMVHLNKIEIQLKKKIPDSVWKRLDSEDASEEDKLKDPTVKKMIVNSSKGPKEVEIKQRIDDGGSSRPIKKNWDALEKEADQDFKKNRDQYGSGYDPSQVLFQQIYEGADENTRRAMNKSFQTSNGTVLSTNWQEVQQKDYEGKDRPDAPKGQEYKKAEF